MWQQAARYINQTHATGRMRHRARVVEAVWIGKAVRVIEAVTGSDDRTARLWDATSGTEIAMVTLDAADLRVVTGSG